LIAISRKLIDWYEKHRRKLPWRDTRDPYRIWISEIMLQQTRVAAVIPYYERFLQRFPDIASLAAAPEPDLLAAWAGLGYYSRARNLQKAARAMNGTFPSSYEAIRELDGIGDYTAAAVGSIAFGLPHAVLDGNVMRVVSRLTNDSADIRSSATKRRFRQVADRMLDRKRPGQFNQALMELGATICLPRQPQCLLCPLGDSCEARQLGTQNQLPVKLGKPKSIKIERTLLIIREDGKLLMWQRSAESQKLAGFWELPEPEHVSRFKLGVQVGYFRHSITNHNYRFRVCLGEIAQKPSEFEWLTMEQMQKLPLSTTARKALTFF
jgi:A/G-specific adenine glycosylase